MRSRTVQRSSPAGETGAGLTVTLTRPAGRLSFLSNSRVPSSRTVPSTSTGISLIAHLAFSPPQRLAQVFQACAKGVLRRLVTAAVVEAPAVDRLDHAAAILALDRIHLQHVLHLLREVDQRRPAVLAGPQFASAFGQPIGRRHRRRKRRHCHSKPLRNAFARLIPVAAGPWSPEGTAGPATRARTPGT